MRLDDTIAAIATASGGGARGIVRASGPQAASYTAACFKADPSQEEWQDSPRARRIEGAVHLEGLAPFPCGLYFWPGRRSYTREPVVEFHTLGSPPLLAALMRALCQAGARLAEPGEFTLRAFLSGRIDLTQAEAVLGVIEAAGAPQLAAALDQLAGGLGGPLRSVRERLWDLLAQMEAELDFAEEDIPALSPQQLTEELSAAAEMVEQAGQQLAGRAEGADYRRVVLRGAPNTGKSSLFNALVGRDAALVSPQAGTTRDYLAARFQCEGIAWELVDTAGIEPASTHSLDQAAQQLAQQQQNQADLVLYCLDGTRRLSGWELEHLARTPGEQQLLVLTKCDAPAGIDLPEGLATIRCSSLTREGVDALRSAIEAAITSGSPSEAIVGTAIRCGESLRLAAQAIQMAKDVAARRGGEELVAAEIRIALEELGRVVGAVYTEDILDRVFSRFCIGK